MDIAAIVGTSLPIPIVCGTTFLSLLVGTLVNTFAIPIEYHTLSNIVIVILPSLSLLLSVYLYAFFLLLSPTLRAIAQKTGAEEIDPETILFDASHRAVLVTFSVVCWHRDEVSGKKINTYMSTHTYELEHNDETAPLPGIPDSKVLRLVLKPDVLIDERARLFLDGLRNDLYLYYKSKDKYCSVKYNADIPSASSVHTIVTGKQTILLSKRLLLLMVLLVLPMPVYLGLCYWHTKRLTHKVTKRILPSFHGEAYPTVNPEPTAPPAAEMPQPEPGIVLSVPE